MRRDPTTIRTTAEGAIGPPAGEAPGWLMRWCRSHPILAILGVAVAVNLIHTGFNVGYNVVLIRERWMSPRQQEVFVASIPVYNSIAYPLCLLLMVAICRPLARVHRRVLAGEDVPEPQMAAARRLLVDLPFLYFCINALGWLPGAIVFPAIVTLLGEGENLVPIWTGFACSFIVSALVTIVQMFFVVEEFLIRVLYPLYFTRVRPADLSGRAPRISFPVRLGMLYAAVGLMPLLALHLVALNYADTPAESAFAWLVFAIGTVSAAIVVALMAWGLLHWVAAHRRAMEELARGNLQARDPQKRPDEWGRLTDHFNDMAEAIEQAEIMRETFGQVVHPEVRDAIMQRFRGIEGEVCDITVLFADIRGFTRRSAGQPPDTVFRLLNRFLSLSVQAIEDHSGIVDKFLGDGVMALFGAPPRSRDDHADCALAAAVGMYQGLSRLNTALEKSGDDPLHVGIGVHSGPALVGCPGAIVHGPDGLTAIRRSFTAIGETVNLAQRVEQLTKSVAGPILLSAATKRRLRRPWKLIPMGSQEVPGFAAGIEVYRPDLDQVPAGSEDSASCDDRRGGIP